MKLYNPRLALLLIMAAPSLLQAMQPAEPKLSIMNNTASAIELKIKQSGHESTWRVGRSKLSDEIQSPQTLEMLNVGGISILDDAKRKAQFAEALAQAKRANMNIQMNVNPTTSRSWFSSNPPDISFELVGKTAPRYSSIQDYFPLVHTAIAERREILPYYFFNLQSDASLENATTAYRQEEQKLRDLITRSTSPEDKRFYKDVLEFVQMAFQAITGGASKRSEFANYVEEKLLNAPTGYLALRPSVSAAAAGV